MFPLKTCTLGSNDISPLNFITYGTLLLLISSSTQARLFYENNSLTQSNLSFTSRTSLIYINF